MAKKPKDKCHICIFRANSTALEKCDYFYFTGQTRKAEPPSECTYFKPGKRLDRPIDSIAISIEDRNTKYDWNRARDLYSAGKNDKEIAQELDCSESTVWNWRRRNGLPSNATIGWVPGRKRGKDAQDVSE